MTSKDRLVDVVFPMVGPNFHYSVAIAQKGSSLISKFLVSTFDVSYPIGGRSSSGSDVVESVMSRVISSMWYVVADV